MTFKNLNKTKLHRYILLIAGWKITIVLFGNSTHLYRIYKTKTDIEPVTDMALE